MKAIKNLATILAPIVFTLVLIGWHPINNNSDIYSNENIIVLLKFKTQPGKEKLAFDKFQELLNTVQKEPNFISIKLHVDPTDSTNILLYEEWKDLTYYTNAHMNTVHLKEFMQSSTNFLAGPPETTFWELKRTFK